MTIAGLMSASDSPVVRPQRLPVTDQQLCCEELRTDLVENEWSSRKTALFAVLASLILWAWIILAISRVF